jgi:hypothetical protein
LEPEAATDQPEAAEAKPEAATKPVAAKKAAAAKKAPAAPTVEEPSEQAAPVDEIPSGENASEKPESVESGS